MTAKQVIGGLIKILENMDVVYSFASFKKLGEFKERLMGRDKASAKTEGEQTKESPTAKTLEFGRDDEIAFGDLIRGLTGERRFAFQEFNDWYKTEHPGVAHTLKDHFLREQELDPKKAAEKLEELADVILCDSKENNYLATRKFMKQMLYTTDSSMEFLDFMAKRVLDFSKKAKECDVDSETILAKSRAFYQATLARRR